MRTSTPKAHPWIKRWTVAALALCGIASPAHANGLVSGQYHFAVPYSPVCLDGVYPLSVGEMTTGCTLQAKVDSAGNVQGTLDLRTLKGPISGTLKSSNGRLVLQLATTGQDVSQTATQIQSELHAGQFTGTATTHNGTVAATLDVSSAGPLVVSFDLDIAVDTNGKVTGSGTATSCNVTVPVQVSGTTASDKSSLHVVGANNANFVWDGSGKPNYTGFAADYTASGFGVTAAGTSLMVARRAAAPALLANISTRLSVQTGDNALIGGFIITGTQAKKVIVRAIGPSLPLSGKLADPTLELHDSSGGVISSNDNWIDAANKQAIVDSKLGPTSNKESAILTTLDPGAYTAIVRGVRNAVGIALIEVYDLDSSAAPRLANISTRGFVQTGDNILIGGFILLGNEAQRVLIRAIGPSLPLANTLSDPVLELHDPNGDLLALNDNWVGGDALSILTTQLAPTSSKESAILATLPPGAYTAIVRGAGASTGVAVVEVYGLQP